MHQYADFDSEAFQQTFGVEIPLPPLLLLWCRTLFQTME